MLDERGGIPPFGWAIACAGRKPAEVEHDVRALVRSSTSAWTRHFPAERGYQVVVEPAADPAQGLRMSVRRGEFEATVAIEHELELRGRGAVSASPLVRMFGRARANAVVRANAVGDRLIRHGRLIGGGVGLCLFLLLGWFMIGVNNPVYMLGGMLLMVALMMALVAGSTLGAWVGERLAARSVDRVVRLLTRDADLHDDIRRWKAVSRLMVAQRTTLAGHRRSPFRSEPSALAS
ncbi:hypothetical protein [Paraliomyxa miuraensis]|uniref:hypothetical protein n=1 Tax=Paraliomyxa miuraensis TaxID=376150 RepID=UPI002255111F|nr:hypothetical protein [Paraliomyxa miuraensis]MCX4243774.1 hypothetical protein [Paraliomyxa miuraensis]